MQCFASVVLEMIKGETNKRVRKGCLGSRSDPELSCRGEAGHNINVMCCEGTDYCNSDLHPTLSTLPKSVEEGNL